jgi:MFS family permease
MSTVQVGVLLASVWGAQLVAMPFLGSLSDKLGRVRTTLLGFVVSACLFLLYFFAETSSQIFAISITVGVSLSVATLLLALIPSVAPDTMYGTVVGVYGSFEDLGVIISPIVFGFIWSAYGAVFIFAASAITQLITGFLILMISHKN